MTTETKLTAIERFAEVIRESAYDYPDGEGTYGGIPLTQYRLAADCIAFVREFQAANPISGATPWSEDWANHMNALATRIEEASIE